MKVYIASSWRNQQFDSVVDALEEAGFEVYNFKKPAPGNNGFHWSDIDPNWKEWTPEQFRAALDHEIALDGFESDMDALEACDACVLVMPCGRSAHLELGWACGQWKTTVILLADGEPELMVKMADHICVTIEEVIDALRLP